MTSHDNPNQDFSILTSPNSSTLLNQIDEVNNKQVKSCETQNTFETYYWGKEKRVRVSSMLEGGYSGSGFLTTQHSKTRDVDDDLEVEQDETFVYGNAQYSERDLVRYDDNEETPLIREMIMGDSDSALRHQRVDREKNTEKPEMSSPSLPNTNSNQNTDTDSNNNHIDENANANGGAQLLIGSLRALLKQQEKLLQKSIKCLVCLELYDTPLTSIQCWHVHCEECWLRTLGNKKLCPQCNAITSPSDLRRIYL